MLRTEDCASYRTFFSNPLNAMAEEGPWEFLDWHGMLCQSCKSWKTQRVVKIKRAVIAQAVASLAVPVG